MLCVTTPLKTGSRLRSQVCTTEVIVVRPGSRELALSCGGHPLIEMGGTPADGLTLDPAFAGGTLLGKRYTLPDDDSLEILATKGGDGALSDGPTLLVPKEAKPLPASD